jgi:hypothetical protein
MNIQEILYRMLTSLCQFVRMENNTMKEQVIACKPKGKRALGIPLKKWDGTITGHMDLHLTGWW